MSNVEKEYRKRFSGKQEKNDNFDKEALWSAINSEIQPPKKKRRIGAIWFMLGLAIISASLIYRISNKSQTDIISATAISKEMGDAKLTLNNSRKDATLIISESNDESVNDYKKITSEKSYNSTHIDITTPLFAQKQKTKSLTSQEVNTRKEILGTSINRNNNFKLIDTYNAEGNKNNSINNRNHRPTESNSPLRINYTESINNEKEKDISSHVNNSSVKEFSSIDIIKQQEIKFSRTEITNNTIYRIPYLENSDNDISDISNQRNTVVDIYGGVNQTNFTYSLVDTKIGSLLNESTHSIMGNTFGAALSYPIFRNIKGTIGIEHQNLWTQTKINIDTRTTTRLDSQLVKVVIDSESLDTIYFVYQDTIVGADYQRNILHHNNIKTISIPLNIGYHYSIKNIEIGINLGLIYSIRYHQNGKAYNNQGAIASYDKSSPVQPYDRFAYSLRLAPIVRYNFNEQYSAVLSPIYQYDSGSYYSEATSSAKTSIWHWTIGIGKRF